MQVRSVKSKKISIFSVVLLFTLILGWLGNYFSPISEVSASDIADDYSVPIVLNHYHVGLDGQIDITTQIDFTATAAFNTLNLSLPYADGQSIIFSGMRTADLTAEGEINYNQVQSAIPNQNNASETYRLHDTGTSLDIELNTAFPSSSRRIIINYTLINPFERYNDSATGTINILNAKHTYVIGKLGLLFTFEAEIYPHEEALFTRYEHNNLGQIDNIVHAISLEDLYLNLGVKVSARPAVSEYNFAFLAENIVTNTSLDLRLVFPSDWIALQGVSLYPGAVRNMRAHISEIEADYRRTLIQRYEYRDKVRVATVVLLGVVLLYYAIVLIRIFVNRRFNVREIIETPPDDAHPASLAFLERNRVNARVIWSIVYSLSYKGFINLNESRIKRVNEQLLSDLEELEDFEKIVLHWIWASMRGEDEITINQLHISFSSTNNDNLERLARLSRTIEAYCIEKGWLKFDRQIEFNYLPLILGVIYMVLAFVLTYISDYKLPLILLLPGIIFVITAFVSSEYTASGLLLMRQTNSFTSYLSNIDRYLDTDEVDLGDSKEKFSIGLIYAIALDVDKEYLQSVKYILPMLGLAQDRVYSRVGFAHTEAAIIEASPDEGDIPLKRQSKIYDEMHDLVEKRLREMQNALGRLRMGVISSQENVTSTADKAKPVPKTDRKNLL